MAWQGRTFENGCRKHLQGVLFIFFPKFEARILRTRQTSGCAEGLPGPLCARYTACVALALEYLHIKERKAFARQKTRNCITLCSSFFSVSNFSEKLLLLATSFPSPSISCRRLSFATSNQKMFWPGAWCLCCFSSHCFDFFPMFCCPFGFKLEMSEITSGVDANGVAKLADFGLACPMRLEETPNNWGKNEE